MWGTRQWAIKTYNLWDEELEFVDQKLKEDFRNNSAWNHRFFVIQSTTSMTVEDRLKEIEFAFEWIKKAPNNQSPWNYVSGMMKGMKYSEFPQVKSTCEELLEKHAFCSHVKALLVNIYTEEKQYDKARALLEELIKSDVIKAKYWQYRLSTLPTATAE